ncbi:hypothetical protein SAMN04488122_1411 [Chitinophaga arvensicola]|uniref:Uncharacterized protein n=1 Tax=Chitinophaga arvensicola TaxID=29529 RepID=A0A1I0QER1_9BACT|nr:hypothetical protein SAMN04488122_1411 [Chitinophaga arvensicola]
MLQSSIISGKMSNASERVYTYFYKVFENIKNNVLWQTGKLMNHTVK